MRRWILTIASLGVIALWLVLAYVPSLPRPTLGWPAWSGAPLAVLAGVGLLAAHSGVYGARHGLVL